MWIATRCKHRVAMTAAYFLNKILRFAVGVGLLFKDFRVELDLGSAVTLKSLKSRALPTQG